MLSSVLLLNQRREQSWFAFKVLVDLHYIVPSISGAGFSKTQGGLLFLPGEGVRRPPSQGPALHGVAGGDCAKGAGDKRAERQYCVAGGYTCCEPDQDRITGRYAQRWVKYFHGELYAKIRSMLQLFIAWGSSLWWKGRWPGGGVTAFCC